MPEFLPRFCRDTVPDGHRVSAFFLSREGVGEGEKGMQEKGNVSRTLPTICLHIGFSRDMPRLARDTRFGNGGFPSFWRSDHETRPVVRSRA